MSTTLTRWGRLLAVLTVLMSSAACSDTASPRAGHRPVATGTTAEETTAPAEPFRVALVAPSATNDLAFTQSMSDALSALEEAEASRSRSRTTCSSWRTASAIQSYASEGYDLVIAHGSQFGASVEEIAKDFPEVSFAWGTAGDTFGLPNVFAYQAASDQGGYVQGVIAAGLSTSKVIGVVGPIEVGDAKLYVDGFKSGVADTDSSIDVRVTTPDRSATSGWRRRPRGLRRRTPTMTAPPRWSSGRSGSLGERRLVRHDDQTSRPRSWRRLRSGRSCCRRSSTCCAGTLGGESYTIDLANGGEVIAYNDGYAVPEDVLASAEEATAGLIDGSIETGATAG
jgi:basic membrane protein A